MEQFSLKFWKQTIRRNFFYYFLLFLALTVIHSFFVSIYFFRQWFPPFPHLFFCCPSISTVFLSFLLLPFVFFLSSLASAPLSVISNLHHMCVCVCFYVFVFSFLCFLFAFLLTLFLTRTLSRSNTRTLSLSHAFALHLCSVSPQMVIATFRLQRFFFSISMFPLSLSLFRSRTQNQ